MPQTDLPAAARRVAVYVRARLQFSKGNNPLLPDLLALLPLLDAAGAEPGADRVERLGRVSVCSDANLRTVLLAWTEPEYPTAAETKSADDWAVEVLSRIIALADAERAAAADDGWRAYEAALSDFKDAVQTDGWGERDARATLDAAVRRLAGMGQEGKP